jgi:F-type H+-transporting ATPase subunit b
MTIDWWTLGIQTVNVGILVWLLGRFFWRPLASMIEQRRMAAVQILKEAETKRTEAASALVEIERTRAGFGKEQEAILAAAQSQAEQSCAARLEDAAKSAALLQAAASAAIEKEKQAAEKGWDDTASQLAIDIATRLVGRLDSPAVCAAFMEGLVKEINDLPDLTRQSAAMNGAVLEAVSATTLEPAEQERFGELVATAFGAHPQITFRADPALIAGIELHGPHLRVSNNWRSDLAQILKELSHDDRH